MAYNFSENSKTSETSSSTEPKKENPCYGFPLASFELLNKYGGGLTRLIGEKLNESASDNYANETQKLSTDQEEMKTAYGKSETPSRLVQSSFSSSLISLSNDETNDSEVLIHFLLASAEKVGEKQFDCANNLLKYCSCFSSSTGNPVQRVVYYFTKALREKIDREMGKIFISNDTDDKKRLAYIEDAMMYPNPVLLTVYQQMPFSRAGDFTGVQAIIDNIVGAKKVHLIDFTIRCGAHTITLMHDLANRQECPIELLRITAVVTKSLLGIEETGKRLMSFAESLKLPFSYKIVLVKDMLDLREEIFEVEEDETVAICSRHFLWTMIEQPNRIENLMKVIKKINPSIMLTNEVEADHNTPFFLNRFIEALSYYVAYFDSINNCMGRPPDDPNRMIMESVYFGEAIRNLVVMEGEERTVRHVKIKFWREVFESFGMREVELSEPSLYQASLLVNNFGYGNCCTFDMDGNCLIVGWKGRPFHSISAWKFM